MSTAQSLRTSDELSWETVAPERFLDPAIVFPSNQAYMFGLRTTAFGFLVLITRKENGQIWAREARFCSQWISKFPRKPWLGLLYAASLRIYV